MAKYTLSNDYAVSIERGRMRGLREGSATVEATYKDPLGNVLTKTFTVRSTFFPFASEFINTSFFGQGTYNERLRRFSPSQYGQMGWQYTDGADWSEYKYLVIRLKQAQTCDAHLNIFTANSIWSDCCATPSSGSFGSSRRIVLKLREAKYTSGSKEGQPLDLKNIHIVAFWGNGSGSINVDQMYLTDNDDLSPVDPDAIEMVESSPSCVDVYSVGGICVRRGVPAEQALQNLPRGIYVIDGRKVVH